MKVFKTFLKVLKKNKWTIILYTALLIFFGTVGSRSIEKTDSFVREKTPIYIINNDEVEGITKDFIKYLEDKNEVKKDIDNLEDALFYKDVHIILTIPKNFRSDYLNGKSINVKYKSSGNIDAISGELSFKRYLNLLNVYQDKNFSEEEIINLINNTLKEEVNTKLKTVNKTGTMKKAKNYYRFSNYSILAITIYIIVLISTVFKEEKIRKRTIISSYDYKKYNKELLLYNSIFSFVLVSLYILLSFIVVGKEMFTIQGLIIILNTYLFSFVSLTMALLISSLVNNKNIIMAIVNIVALGSSFISGAFVPMEFIPDKVLSISKLFPSYWYIKNINIISDLEKFSSENTNLIIKNIFILFMFSIIYLIINQVILIRKRKVG